MAKTRILGLITARGGSKGIPGKNIKPLAGKPLIAYTIEAAKGSGVIDRLITSTDDAAIAQVARELGSEVPFMRPAELADDTAPHLPVLLHAIEWLKENEGYEPDYVALLQPTSPLRSHVHLREAAERLLADPEADAVISALPVPEAFNSKKLMSVQDGYLRMHDGSPVYKRTARRQDLRPEYSSAGLSVLIFKTALLYGETPNFYGERTLPYVMDPQYAIDINEPADWQAAEEVIALMHKNA